MCDIVIGKCSICGTQEEIIEMTTPCYDDGGGLEAMDIELVVVPGCNCVDYPRSTDPDSNAADYNLPF